jgi:N-acetylneuraminate lyase/4-hydroxy-tetrahydrodipicolinate synthase
MITSNRLSGVIVPTITPFHEDGELFQEAFEKYLDYLAGKVHGISVGAIYGSGILMRAEQRQRMAEIAVQTMAESTQVSVFVGAPDTDTAVQLAKHAEKIGVNAVSCVQPFYYRQVDEAIYRHYLAILQAVSIPVYAYDSPVYAGNQLSLNVLARLADSGLAGVITGAATFGLEHLWSVLRNVHVPGFDVWSIRDGLALPGMMMGSIGFESGVANFFPELVVELYNEIIQKDFEKAILLQNRILRLRDISHQFGRNIPTLHALISMRGLITGFPRRPFYKLDDSEISKLKEDLRSLDFELPFV